MDYCKGLDAATLLGMKITSLGSLRLQEVVYSTIAHLPDFLAQQQQHALTHLEVHFAEDDSDYDPNDATRLAAHLTASSRLEHLDLCECHILPTDWPLMFPKGRLPQLRHLGVPVLLYDGNGHCLSAADVLS